MRGKVYLGIPLFSVRTLGKCAVITNLESASKKVSNISVCLRRFLCTFLSNLAREVRLLPDEMPKRGMLVLGVCWLS